MQPTDSDRPGHALRISRAAVMAHELLHHRSSLRPLKNGCRTLPSADFARYSIAASNSGSTQTPLCAIFLV
jgi:hypothetical protein